MSKKPLFLIAIISLLLPCAVSANLEFNEIMYDLKTGSDTGREWIEIYNDGDNAVNISKYKLGEADTNHVLKLVEGDFTVPPFGYALIVSDASKFKTDWPNTTGAIFDSSFSLSNSGEDLILKDEKLNIINEYAYKINSGGAGDGKSQQKINNVWMGEIPTPLTENKVTYVPPPVAKVAVTPKITTKIPVTTSQEEKSENSDVVLPPQITKSDVLVENPKEVKLFTIIFTIFLGICTFLVYFVRRKKANFVSGDDFEILED